MYKARTEEVARAIARKQKQCFGLSVFSSPDGWPAWLVGTREELERAGVPSAQIKGWKE